MKAVIEAWGEADLAPVRGALDENVVWRSASSREGGAFRFGGVYRGRDNVIELLSKLSTSYFFQEYARPRRSSRRAKSSGACSTFAGSYLPSSRREGDSRPIAFETASSLAGPGRQDLEAQSFSIRPLYCPARHAPGLRRSAGGRWR